MHSPINVIIFIFTLTGTWWSREFTSTSRTRFTFLALGISLILKFEYTVTEQFTDIFLLHILHIFNILIVQFGVVLIYLNNLLNFLKVVSETLHPNLEFGTLCIQNETLFAVLVDNSFINMGFDKFHTLILSSCHKFVFVCS
jgi:hypothetical protein